MKAATLLVATMLVAIVLVPPMPADTPAKDTGRADEDLLEWVNPTPTGSTLSSIGWPASSSFALIVGNAGTVLKYEPFGKPVFTLLRPGVSDDLNGIAFRPGGAGALIVGDAGTVLLYEGGTFQALASGTQKNLHEAVWAPDGSAALLLGDDGTLLYFEGTQVLRLNTTTLLDIYAGAWAPGNGYALLVGEKGLACRANLTAFETISSGVATDLNDVAYRPGSYATVVGYGGVVQKYDGLSFSADRTAPLQNFNAVAWRSDGSGALVVGLDNSDIQFTQASTCTLSETELVKVQNNITDRMLDVVWEPDSAMALIVGVNGLVTEYSGGSFQPLSAAVAQNMLAADWRPDGSVALVAGAKGYLARFDGATLVQVQTNEVTELDAVAWDPSGSQALVCGRGGIVLRYTHSNSSIERLATGLEGTINYTAVSWKPDGSCALLCGEAGKIVRYNGSAFVLQQTLNPLYQVNYWDMEWRPDGAYALIAGVSGNILRYEERALPAPLDFCVTKAAPSAPGVSFFSVSWLPDPARAEALVVGTNGALYRYNESGATGYTTDTKRALYAVDWMPKSEYALAVGDGGKLLEFVGYGFIHPASGTDAVFRGVSWRPDGSYALIAGYSGALLKFTMAKRSSPRAIISSPRQNAVFEPGATILFDGGNSTPTFGQGLTFQWLSNLSGPLGNGGRLAKVLGAGRHRVTLFANDTTGHSGTASVDIVVKAPNRSPVITIDSPLEGGTYNNTDDILFDASRSSDPDGDPLSFFWTSSRAGYLGAGPVFSASLGIGSHTITVWLNDSMGYNISRSVAVTVVLFNQPPVPAIGSPRSDGDYNDRTPVLFDAAASVDGDGDVLDFYWTSNVSGYLGSSSKFSRSLPAGAHSITVWTDDSRGGNRSASVNITVKKANLAPSVAFDAPAEGAVLKGAVELSGVAVDPEGAALLVAVQIDEYEWDLAGGGAVWNYTFNTSRFANGKHTVRVKSTDGVLESNITTRTFKVANPDWGWTVLLSFPLDGTKVHGKVKLEGTASRMGSLVSQVEVKIDNGDWVIAKGATQWSSVWDSTKAKNGAHKVAVRAYDGTDYSPEAVITLNVDNEPAPAAPLSLWGLLFIAVAVVLVIAAAFVLMRRKPAGGPGTTAGKDEEE